MKNIKNSNRIQKMVIAIVMILVLNFSIPSYVHAGIGGMLMNPAVDLFSTIADAFVYVLEWSMTGDAPTLFMRGPNTIDPEYLKDESEANITIEGSNLTSIGDSLMEALTNPMNGGIIKVIADGIINGSDFGIPIIKFSPEEIFANQVPLLDINFLNPSVKDKDGSLDGNIAQQLRDTIAGWYVAIRSIAIVGLLSVLVYCGIRMIMTSVAAEKAKYKNMIVDWLVAICLVLVLHYIMSLTLTICDTITSFLVDTDKLNSVVIHITESATNKAVTYRSNFIGYTRLMLQSKNGIEKVAFFVLYIIFVVYSFRFAWIYLKRVLNMAFLTLMAPLVALTYPIDKISDNKAQAFNTWLREYIFNALLQPFHLLLFFILISSAIDLATEHLIYPIVAFAFINSAEKLLRKMFGFEKASGGTVGTLSAATGGALLGNAINMLSKAGKNGGNSGSKNKDGVRIKDVDKELQGEGMLDSLGAVEEGGINSGVPQVDTLEQPQIEPPTNAPHIGDNDTDTDSPLINDYLDFWDEQNDDGEDYNDMYMAGAYDVPEEANSTSATTQTQNDGNSASAQSGNASNPTPVRTFNPYESPEELGYPEEFEDYTQNEKKQGRMQKMINSKPAKMLGTVAYHGAKGLAKGTFTAAAALTGLGIGLGTGDVSKGMSFAVAMGAGTRGILNKADRELIAPQEAKAGVGSIKGTYETLRYGSSVAASNARYDKKFRQSAELDNHVDYYNSGKSHQEKEKIKDDYLFFMQKTGKTDLEELRKMVKLENEYTKNEIINTVKMNKMINERAFANGKEGSPAYEKAIEQVKRQMGELKDKNGNIVNEEAKRKIAIRTLESIEKFREQ